MKYDLAQHIAGTCVHFRRKASRCAAGHTAAQVQDEETGRLPCRVLGTDQLPPCPSRRLREDREAQALLAEVIEAVSDRLER